MNDMYGVDDNRKGNLQPLGEVVPVAWAWTWEVER